MAPKSGHKRGFAVAILVGFDQGIASIWRVYSQAIKPEATIHLEGAHSDLKALYNFHESIVNWLRAILKEGVRSIILVSPPRTTYGQKFAEHIKDHHAWLTQGASKVTLTVMTGSAVTRTDLMILAKKSDFRTFLQDATFEETENLLELLEKRLNSPDKDDIVLYSLEDIEDSILYSQKKNTMEFLLLTDEHLAKPNRKRRINRLMQIAVNRNIKTRVVVSNTPAGKRLTQLGGIALIARKS
jgi:stalled ribosome rescue protein Dom34